MSETFRIREGITFTPLPNAAAGDPAFAIRSPETGGLLEISLTMVRLFAAFGAGATLEKVTEQLASTEQERGAVVESARELMRLGLVTPAVAAPQAVKVPPIFVLSAPGSAAVKLQEALSAHPLLVSTPLASLIQASYEPAAIGRQVPLKGTYYAGQDDSWRHCCL